jgi:serine/threonine-protein kinase
VANTTSDLLPILTSDLVDDEALDFLMGVALAGGTARIPLIAPPIDATDHLLEVYSPGSPDPLLLIALPVGLPDDQGFPLKLRPAQQSAVRVKRAAGPPSTADLRAKRHTVPTLTKRHSRDLMGADPVDTTAPAALIGRTIAGGKLLIEELVGTGGIGAVYKARHAGLNMPVAVKVLHESVQSDVDFCKRFHSEALALSQLDHPNLTRVHDFGQESDGLLYIAMEFLQGKSLRTVLESDGRLGSERSVKLMMQVCAGLVHVHARALVHRDIKPDNLLVLQGMDDDGDPVELLKVCDFGIAVGGQQANARLAGTPDYMSPEQCMGQPLDARSDVYACGVVLYELATGRAPFDGEDATGTMRAHVHTQPQPPSQRAPGLDPLLEAVILKALSKDPADRQQGARELRRELRAVQEAPKKSAPPPRHVERPLPSQSQPASRLPDDGRDFASTLVRDPTPFLERLAAANGERRFAEVVMSLDAALPKLIERGEVATLWTLVSALDVVAKEQGPRASIAGMVLKPLADPQTLAPIADLALAGSHEVAVVAGKLIVRGGVGGAYAIFTARVKNHEDTARTRVRTLLQAIGVAALPVLRSALERILANSEVYGALEIATDLLVSLPPAEDDALGNIVARYAKASDGSLAAAAISALPRLWGARACALLIALMQHPGEPARVAAVNALRGLNAVDEHVVRKLASLAADPTFTSPGVRLASAHALVGAQSEARSVAAAVLARAVTSWGAGPEVVDLARCFLEMCGKSGVSLVRKRAAECAEPVRGELERLTLNRE